MDNWRNGLFSRLVHGLGAALCTALVLLWPPVQAAPQTPFVAATGGVWDGPGNSIVPEVLASSAVGPVLVETGALPAAYGKFRSEFGSNGFSISVTGGIDREVDGGSIWSDGFVVNGGTGSGTLKLSTHIVGAAAGEVEMVYALFVSDNPFDLQAMLGTIGSAPGLWAVQFPTSVRVIFTGIANRCGLSHASDECGHVPLENYQGPLDLALTASVPFTFGQTFYVASLFGGGVSIFGGSAAFFNSANFGITVPAGTTLASMSGSVYATAVPEPAAWMLLVAGLCATVVLRRRRHALMAR